MIQLDWDDSQKTTLRYTFVDPWTWNDYHATNIKRDALFANVTHMVDIILDFTDGKHIPSQAMTHFRKAAAWDDPKRGVVIVVGVNMMLQALANIMISVYPQAALKTPRPAKDLEDARRMIRDIQSKRDTNNGVS